MLTEKASMIAMESSCVQRAGFQTFTGDIPKTHKKSLKAMSGHHLLDMHEESSTWTDAAKGWKNEGLNLASNLELNSTGRLHTKEDTS